MAKTLASLETSSNRLTIQPTNPLVLFIVTLEAWMGNLKKDSATEKSWPSLCSGRTLFLELRNAHDLLLMLRSNHGEYLISTTCTNSVIPSTVPFVSSHSSSRFFFDSAALIEHCKLVGVSCYFEQSGRAVHSSSTQPFLLCWMFYPRAS